MHTMIELFEGEYKKEEFFVHNQTNHTKKKFVKNFWEKKRKKLHENLHEWQPICVLNEWCTLIRSYIWLLKITFFIQPLKPTIRLRRMEDVDDDNVDGNGWWLSADIIIGGNIDLILTLSSLKSVIEDVAVDILTFLDIIFDAIIDVVVNSSIPPNCNGAFTFKTCWNFVIIE